jgi:sensor histidine kinase YesM
LGSIQNSIINEEPDKAVKYLSRFSKLMRNILDSSHEETISMAEERSTIENYLELQKVRFPRKFDYSIEVDEEIDMENTFIPPMLAQPFIENAIEHGIKLKETKGNIRVRFKLNGKTMLYELEDDGIGRKKAQEILQKQNKDHKSLATSITQERIIVLNRKLKHKIKLEIIDLKDEQGEAAGTRVIFEIPVLS